MYRNFALLAYCSLNVSLSTCLCVCAPSDSTISLIFKHLKIGSSPWLTEHTWLPLLLSDIKYANMLMVLTSTVSRLGLVVKMWLLFFSLFLTRWSFWGALDSFENLILPKKPLTPSAAAGGFYAKIICSLQREQLYYLISSIGKSSQLSQNPSKQSLIGSSAFVDSFLHRTRSMDVWRNYVNQTVN